MTVAGSVADGVAGSVAGSSGVGDGEGGPDDTATYGTGKVNTASTATSSALW